MIKIELIEVIHRNHPQVLHQIIEQHCGRAFNQLLYDTFKSDMSNFDLYAKEYKNVPVLYDADTNTWYSNFPEQICQLPDHAEGVRRINRMKSKHLAFVPIKKDSQAVFNSLVVSKIDQTIGYMVTKERIEYDRNPNVPEEEGLKMDIVIPFEKYEYEDEIHIPAGQDENFMKLVEQFLTGTPIEPKTSN